ncbi:hypothetical protein M1I50_09080 [Clostridioides difficile]|uniref:hypothetical protein n=1 Tax=Clostridioides difficile TaxID=1496 RepID=UPI0009433D42|nr:hypothetical protein [Clostridioides difficile]MBZ4494510.1 hypothetical protein [Clostridioides difficile]MCL0943135.1 hypothetical protein [Clostridioides difficile]MCM4101087.1 hypothetical protein [Clostridioides difficile]MDI2845688.1 hypothetical protein [Clostridioides difficile]MDO0132379.1 hypothetical protein [Clostridioides difficile]
MLIEGTKIRLMKEIQGFEMLKIGDIFVITSVGNNGDIHFKTDYGMGFMSYSEFKEHFEIVNNKEKKKYNWDDWKIRASLSMGDTCRYRTNHKKVIVDKDGFKASATCHDIDEFNLDKGIKLCLARIEVKKAKHKLNLLLDEINDK